MIKKAKGLTTKFQEVLKFIKQQLKFSCTRPLMFFFVTWETILEYLFKNAVYL